MMHRLAHLFNCQGGRVVTVRVDGDTRDYWIAFQCSTCGDITSLTRPFGFDWREYKEGISRNGVKLTSVNELMKDIL